MYVSTYIIRNELAKYHTCMMCFMYNVISPSICMYMHACSVCYFSLFYRWSISHQKRRTEEYLKKKKLHAAIRTCHHYKNGKSIPFSIFAYVERISRESVELLVLFV